MSTNSNALLKTPAINKLRAVFARERQQLQDSQFDMFLRILEQKEYKTHQEAVHALDLIYTYWSDKFELLKREFNSVRGLFDDIERRVTNWYSVSPNLAKWQSVAVTRSGYTFAAGVMKNHHRKAPRSEKSLSVSFGLDEKPEGIGDETALGFEGIITDILVGLENCSGKSLQQQLEGAKGIYRQLSEKNIVFRLNHKDFGQQIAKIPLSTLDEYSLRELCQGLFLTLNNDIMSEMKLSTALENPQKLISHAG